MNHFPNIKYYLNPKALVKKEPKLIRRFEVKWKNTTSETMKLLLASAKERVQDTVKDHHEISKKYLSLLVVVLTISSALFAFLFSSEVDSIMTSIAITAILLCSFCIFIIAQMIRPNKFRAPGRIPNKAIKKKTLERPNTSDDDIFLLLINQELLNCQAQIDLNQFYNSRRLDAMDFVIRLLMLGFILISILTIALKSI